MNLRAVVHRCTFVAFWGIHTSAAFLDNDDTDAAITMGMVLLNEAATSKGDVGKRRSKLYFIAKVMLRQLEDTVKLQVNIWLFSEGLCLKPVFTFSCLEERRT